MRREARANFWAWVKLTLNYRLEVSCNYLEGTTFRRKHWSSDFHWHSLSLPYCYNSIGLMHGSTDKLGRYFWLRLLPYL